MAALCCQMKGRESHLKGKIILVSKEKEKCSILRCRLPSHQEESPVKEKRAIANRLHGSDYRSLKVLVKEDDRHDV